MTQLSHHRGDTTPKPVSMTSPAKGTLNKVAEEQTMGTPEDLRPPWKAGRNTEPSLSLNRLPEEQGTFGSLDIGRGNG